MKATKLTAAQQKGVKGKNVSDSIRYLAAKGLTRSQIASALNKRYQHVRNVLVADEVKANASK